MRKHFFAEIGAGNEGAVDSSKGKGKLGNTMEIKMMFLRMVRGHNVFWFRLK